MWSRESVDSERRSKSPTPVIPVMTLIPSRVLLLDGRASPVGHLVDSGHFIASVHRDDVDLLGIGKL